MRIGREEADALFEALADPTRRALVYRLDEVDSMSLTDAAGELEQVGAASNGTDDVVALLHHQHLPKLAAAGLVEYDQSGGTVEADEAIASVREVLDDIPIDEPTGDD